MKAGILGGLVLWLVIGALVYAGVALAGTFNGGPGVDVLFGTDRADLMYGRAGCDSLYGKQGPDSLYGGRGCDVLKGGVGRDYLSGGRGADLIDAQDGYSDIVRGGPGNNDQCLVDLFDSVQGCETTGGIG